MKPAGLAIRLGTPADREFVRELGNRTVKSNRSSLRPASGADLTESYERLLTYVWSTSHVVFIAEMAAVPVGFVIMLDELPDEVTGASQAFVVYLAVDEEWREQGIGKFLCIAAEDEARRRKLSVIAMMVTEENQGAMRLYQHLGYATERRLLCKKL